MPSTTTDRTTESLDDLLSIDDLEIEWSRTAPAPIVAYVNGGAGEGTGVTVNRAALSEVGMCPRGVFDSCPGGFDGLDTTVDLFGTRLSTPLILAPTSPQRLVHPDAELAVAAAATSEGVHTIVSCDSHHPISRIADHSPSGLWCQVFPYQSRDTIARLVDQCVTAGAGAVVITIDASHAARRLSTRRAGYELPGYVDYGTLRATGILWGDAPRAGWIPKVPLTWGDLEWLRSVVSVPLIAKGVTRPVDATRLIDLGFDGLIVSNHGGRQLDGVVSSVRALERIVDVVDDGIPILVDGGVRSGVDVLRLLALGADGVCIGRPYLWGLGLGGAHGVQRAISILHDEMRDGMLQLGLSGVGELDRSFVDRSEVST
jgi:4-hydroxymandelate oxidase